MGNNLKLIQLASLFLPVPVGLVACAATAEQHGKSPGELRFEEKCRIEAEEKIYKTVPDVEGLVLLKVRPQASDINLSDRMWPGAAFAIEAYGDEYIKTFLGYEEAPLNGTTRQPIPITPRTRGYITTTRQFDGLPGYRYVDVIDEKDGKRYRYTGEFRDVEVLYSHSIGGDGKMHKVNNYVLDKVVAPDPSPRYGVTFEDHVIPEDRALNIASSTIKVIDLKTQEILGELTRYAWSPGGPSYNNPAPWLSAYKCPGHGVGAGEATRKFVDQILIPRKEHLNGSASN